MPWWTSTAGSDQAFGNGETRVIVNVAGQSLSIPIKVHLPPTEPQISFRHEVMAVLSTCRRLQRGVRVTAILSARMASSWVEQRVCGSDPEGLD